MIGFFIGRVAVMLAAAVIVALTVAGCVSRTLERDGAIPSASTLTRAAQQSLAVAKANCASEGKTVRRLNTAVAGDQVTLSYVCDPPPPSNVAAEAAAVCQSRGQNLVASYSAPAAPGDVIRQFPDGLRYLCVRPPPPRPVR